MVLAWMGVWFWSCFRLGVGEAATRKLTAREKRLMSI